MKCAHFRIICYCWGYFKVIGNGSFGVVYLAKLTDSNELVAIKKVLQDKRFKVRLSPFFNESLFCSLKGVRGLLIQPAYPLSIFALCSLGSMFGASEDVHLTTRW